MGLAIVELIMAVEDRFQVRITDEEAEQMRTVGDLYTLIIQQMEACTPAARLAFPCPSSVAFYRTRRALMAICGAPRSAVRPDSRLEDLLPLPRRQHAWQEIGQALALSLPYLQRPDQLLQMQGGILKGVLLGGLATVVILPLGGAAPAVGFLSLLASCVAAFFVALLMDRATAGQAVHVPEECATIRSLVERQVTRPRQDLVDGLASTAGRERVWQELCEVFHRQLLIAPDTLTPDTRLDSLDL